MVAEESPHRARERFASLQDRGRMQEVNEGFELLD
jgi:hypothetical protein